MKHRGAMLRIKLRCGAAPLLTAAGSRAGVPREQRTCRICGGVDLETPEHFVSRCPAYAAEREGCIGRLRVLLAGHAGPMLQGALDTASVSLFLGDGLVRDLPADVARVADATICNFLKVAWRKRAPIWKNLCRDDDEWQFIF